jgi:asparagine synthase (glutamine-hydrolysing)
MLGLFTTNPASQPSLEKALRASRGKGDILSFSDPGGMGIVAGPHCWQGQGLAVVADAEIYNSVELGGSLNLNGAAVNPAHLLGLLYLEMGIGFLSRLRGIFSFGIVDQRRKRILVGTDRFGVKPIVYAAGGRDFAFGARIQPLLAVFPRFGEAMDHEAFLDYLNLSAIPTPKTIYKGVRKLPPGHLLVFDGASVTVTPWYDIDYAKWPKTESYFLQELPAMIGDSVGAVLDHERARGRQVGAFLSGGTDSSTIVGMMKKFSREVKAFSIGFDEPGYDELGYARITAGHFGAELHEYIVTPKDVLDAIETVVEVYDEPFGNSSVVPAYFCARLAKTHGIDTLLGGDGGDEIFGGNERYAADKVFARYQQIPAVLRKGLLEPLLKIAPAFHPLIEKGKKYVRRANIPLPDRFYSYYPVMALGMENVFSPEFLETLGPYEPAGWARHLVQGAKTVSDLDTLLYLDMKFTITDNDLRKVTGMAEKAGVRVAYPLLDHPLVDFAAAMPAGLKVKGQELRYAFKRSLTDFLPKAVIDKKKHGFGLPIGVWTRTEPTISTFVQDALLAADCTIRPFFRKGFIEEMFKRHLETGAVYYGDILWLLLMLELWHRQQKKGWCRNQGT